MFPGALVEHMPTIVHQAWPSFHFFPINKSHYESKSLQVVPVMTLISASHIRTNTLQINPLNPNF